MNQTPRKQVGSPEHAAEVVGVGRIGDGAGDAMAQIARDRLIAAVRAAPHTGEGEIRALWRLRVPEDRTLDGLWTLHTWILENAPELLRDQSDSFKYLLELLANEMTPGGGRK